MAYSRLVARSTGQMCRIPADVSALFALSPKGVDGSKGFSAPWSALPGFWGRLKFEKYLILLARQENKTANTYVIEIKI